MVLAVACSKGGSGGGEGNPGAGGDTTTGAGGDTSGAGGAGNATGPGTGGSTGAGTGGQASGGRVGTGGAGGAGNIGGFAGWGVGIGGLGGAGGAVACQTPTPISGGTPVAVAVNLGTTRATVGPDLMGIFTAVWDGNLQNPTNPSWLKAVGIKSIRYPGGSYSDLYHWSTHSAPNFLVGTASEVPSTVNPGTDFGSFVGLLEQVGARAMVTVNYGSNLTNNGPGAPQEAAAWVAYANGSPTNTMALGTDAGGTNWRTVGYWAGLRAAAKLAVDDGLNFLRIAHPAPVGVQYWEVGNELYGNGFYYGGNGWEEDLHLLHNGTPRLGNMALSPLTYGTTFRAFATAMKAVDPTIKVGGIVHWPYTEYTSPNWNTEVLGPTRGNACGLMDFAIDHWYAGTNLTDLLTRPSRDIPMMVSQLHATMSNATNACGAAGATMPIAVSEWGPNYGATAITITPPAGTQSLGVFAANSYAHFMEQGILSAHWLEVHNDGFLGSTGINTPSFGYHGALMGGLLAVAGDAMVQATVPNQGTLGTLAGALEAHASRHADGGVAVMLVNNHPTESATVTVNVSGLAGGSSLPCVGTLYSYEPQPGDADGEPTRGPIFSANNTVVVSVPAHSVKDVVFPAP